MKVKRQEEEISENIEMPQVTGLELQEARIILENLGVKIETIGEGEKVIEQLPKKGIQISVGTRVTIYTE